MVDLSYFDIGDDLLDLKTNPFQEMGDDVDIIDNVEILNNHEVHSQDQREAKDPMQGLRGPMTRARNWLNKLCKIWWVI